MAPVRATRDRMGFVITDRRELMDNKELIERAKFAAARSRNQLAWAHAGLFDDLIAALEALPVPAEVETKTEYKLVWDDGTERYSDELDSLVRRMSVIHGDETFKRTVTVSRSEWVPVTAEAGGR